MKKICSLLTLLVLLSLLAGCSSPITEKDESPTVTTGVSQTNASVIDVAATSVSTTTNDAALSTQSRYTDSTVNTDQNRISRDEAKKIALSAVGVDAFEISGLQIELDYDDESRRWEYEVDFNVKKKEYDVDIDALTGDVLRNEAVAEPVGTSATTANYLISRDEAKRLALERASVTESAISDYEIELDYDDDARRWEYEISFNVGRTEYECEIDAANGSVIYLKTDIDDE